MQLAAKTTTARKKVGGRVKMDEVFVIKQRNDEWDKTKGDVLLQP